MADSNKSLTLRECAAKFGRSEKEIEKTLIDLHLYQRIAKGRPIEPDKVLKLSEHYHAIEERAKAASSVSRGTKKIQGAEVSEHKKRTRGPLSGRSTGLLEKLKNKKAEQAAAAAPAPPPAEEKKPAAMAAGKTVKVAKTTAAKPDAQAAAEDAKASATAAKKADAKKPAKKSTAEKAAKKPAKKTAAKTAAEKPAKAKKTADKKTAAEKPAAKKAAKKAAAKKSAKKPAAKKPAKKTAPADTAEDTQPDATSEAATTTAVETTEAPATTETATAAARKPGYDIEKLLDQQSRHKEERAEKEKQIKEAAAERQKQKEIAKQQKKPAAGKGTTLKLDSTVVDRHKKKRKQNISRSEAREKTADNVHIFQKPTAPVVREVKIPDAISVAKLASEIALKSSVIIRKLMDHGMTVTANELLDRETAWIIVEELGHTAVEAPDDDMEKDLLKRDATGSVIEPRAPVVTVMGHVDHGKTSLLDYIRETRVAPGEAGGITQHIGAYRVPTKVGDVTFIDTPGHALFSQMRARGAKITDLVVLVVAADDGVKPQTIEAINHAKAAGVPLIVAANKIDKPEANIDRVKRELAEQDVLPEDWGGDTMVIPVSAATGEGVDKLLEALAMQTELLELAAPLDVPAVGVIIEARVDKGRGTVATLVVIRGVLRRGEPFLCGTESGRVRMMWNLSNPKLDEARPSMPVEIQGLSGIPEAGAELLVVEDERTAREVATLRQDKSRLNKMASRRLPVGNEDQTALLDAASAAQEWKELNVVVKTDVEGSREALSAALTQIRGKHAGVKIIHSAVGTVTESDIYLAQTGGGVIVAFNVRPDSRARKLAESRGVKILVGNVVYELVEKVTDAVLGLLAPIIEESVIGSARVKKVFSISKVGNIAGCVVEEGVMRSRAPLRLLRDGVLVHEGSTLSLRHFKDEASEVRAGSECGIGIVRYNDIKIGDVIEMIERTETAPEI